MWDFELGELGAADFVHAVDAMADMALDDGPAAAGGGGAPAGAAAAAAPAKTDLSNPDFLSKTKCVAAVSAVLPRRYRAGRALPAATERARPPPPRACVAAAACSCCCSAATTGGARAFLAAPTRRSVLTSAPRGGPPPFLRSPPSACRREAAAIANQVLQGVLSQIAAGKDVADLCDFGDALIAQLCGQVHKTKKLEKGIAFPTCVSVNECVGHFSPLKSESRVLADGDVVKV